jgi:hypothetical protein
VVGLGVLVAGALWGWHRFVDTPDRAVHRLQAALRDGQLEDAHGLVAPELWSVTDPAPPASVATVINDATLAPPELAWTMENDDAVVLEWTSPTAVPEIVHERSVSVARVEGDWRVTSAAPGYATSVDEVAQVLADMRAAADARNGARFLSYALPGEGTCTLRTCPRVKQVIDAGQTHLFVDTIRMEGFVPASLRVEASDAHVTLRWLRRTRFLGQAGLVSLRFDRTGGAWRVSLGDAGHFAALDDELDTWTENHNEMLWRQEMARFVEVRELPGYCDATGFWGICVRMVYPTLVRNLDTKPIRSIKVSKNRAGRYFGNAETTLWGIFLNVAPGEARDGANEISPPIHSSRRWDGLESRPFPFQRVDWIEMEGEPRRVYVPKDYRKASDGSVTFDIVRDTRVAVGVATDRVDELRSDVVTAGYTVDNLVGHPTEK